MESVYSVRMGGVCIHVSEWVESVYCLNWLSLCTLAELAESEYSVRSVYSVRWLESVLCQIGWSLSELVESVYSGRIYVIVYFFQNCHSLCILLELM